MDGLFKILLVKALVFVAFNHGIHNFIPFNNVVDQINEVPVMNMRFFMMDRKEADSETLIKIQDNVEYLNDEFEGIIKFETKEIIVNSGHALLPDLHKEYFGIEELTVDSLVRDIEREGSINVYIFDSYVIEELNAELMGFTPIFRASHKEYANASPSFDRIFLSYSSLPKQTTLVHEMGHFLGLDHPWEMTDINKDMMGLHSDAEIDNNHMAYGLNVESFTYEQLERMQHFALEFRGYLIDRREYYINDNLVSTFDY